MKTEPTEGHDFVRSELPSQAWTCTKCGVSVLTSPHSRIPDKDNPFEVRNGSYVTCEELIILKIQHG